MSLIDRAKADALVITSNLSEFGRTCVFTAPTSEVVSVVGIYNQHHKSFDEMGEQINAKNSSIAVSESLFTTAGYPIRNTDGDVDLTDHKVTADSQNYVVTPGQWYTDDTTGLIVILLSEWE